MKRLIEGESRSQQTLMLDCLEDNIGTDNSVRVIDAFVEALDLSEMGFDASANRYSMDFFGFFLF